MIAGLFDKGAMPALERMVQFTGARHGVLANNIANLSTPYFKPADLDPKSFQAKLGDALERRRRQGDGMSGPLEMRDTRQLRFSPHGIDAIPAQANAGILYHDENNRDLERTMQHLAENTLAHNMAVELIRNQFQVLQIAIRERV